MVLSPSASASLTGLSQTRAERLASPVSAKSSGGRAPRPPLPAGGARLGLADGAQPAPRRAARLSGEREVERRQVAAPLARGRERLLNRRTVALGDGLQDRAPLPASPGARQRPEETREGAVRAHDP